MAADPSDRSGNRTTRRWLAAADELGSTLFDAYFRIRVQGLENLPRRGPVLLAANHSGPWSFDAALVLAALARHSDRPGPYVGFTETQPSLTILRRLLPPVDLRTGGPDEALVELRRGAAVLVFPEGLAGAQRTVWHPTRLQPLGRGGLVRVALQAAAPLVPVAVRGGEHAFPVLGHLPVLARALRLPSLPVTPLFPWLGPLGLLPLPARWSVRLGPPLALPRLDPQAAGDDQRLEEILAELQRRLGSLLDARDAGPAVPSAG